MCLCCFNSLFSTLSISRFSTGLRSNWPPECRLYSLYFCSSARLFSLVHAPRFPSACVPLIYSTFTLSDSATSPAPSCSLLPASDTYPRPVFTLMKPLHLWRLKIASERVRGTRHKEHFEILHSTIYPYCGLPPYLPALWFARRHTAMLIISNLVSKNKILLVFAM